MPWHDSSLGKGECEHCSSPFWKPRSARGWRVSPLYAGIQTIRACVTSGLRWMRVQLLPKALPLSWHGNLVHVIDYWGEAKSASAPVTEIAPAVEFWTAW